MKWLWLGSILLFRFFQRRAHPKEEDTKNHNNEGQQSANDATQVSIGQTTITMESMLAINSSCVLYVWLTIADR